MISISNMAAIISLVSVFSFVTGVVVGVYLWDYDHKN